MEAHVVRLRRNRIIWSLLDYEHSLAKPVCFDVEAGAGGWLWAPQCYSLNWQRQHLLIVGANLWIMRLIYRPQLDFESINERGASTKSKCWWCPCRSGVDDLYCSIRPCWWMCARLNPLLTGAWSKVPRQGVVSGVLFYFENRNERVHNWLGPPTPPNYYLVFICEWRFLYSPWQQRRHRCWVILNSLPWQCWQIATWPNLYSFNRQYTHWSPIWPLLQQMSFIEAVAIGHFDNFVNICRRRSCARGVFWTHRWQMRVLIDRCFGRSCQMCFWHQVVIKWSLGL